MTDKSIAFTKYWIKKWIVFSGCHKLLQKVMSFTEIEIASVKAKMYRILFLVCD